MPDELADKPVFSLGIKAEGSAPESGFSHRFQGFVHVGDCIRRKMNDKTGNRAIEDYTGMELESFYNYKIGMSVTYKGKSGIICAKRAELVHSELIFSYVIGSQELYAPEPTYHKLLHGRGMTGTVVACENETVKLQLDIDVESGKIKSEAELYPFPWRPNTGNLLYCMPEKDTIVTLHIGDINEGKAIVINTLRKEGGTDTDKPENRYLTTADNKRLFMKQKEIGFSLEDKEDGKTRIVLDDEKGMLFQTKGKITIQAKGRIEIDGKTVMVEGKKEVSLTQNKAQIGLRSRKVSITGTSVHLMPGVTTPELAEAAYQQSLKEMQAKEAETKSSEALMSGILKTGKKDKKSVVSKKLDSGKKAVNFGEQFEKKDRKKVLKANVRYTTPDGYTYETDDLGRIVSVRGQLKSEDGERNPYAQSHVGKGDGRRETDDGGHLIATIFNGSGDVDNLVPMDSNLNRGSWRVMEDEWSKALNEEPPKNVEVKIKPIYDDDSKRPTRFEVEYRIDNEEWERKRFKNENQKEI